MSSDDCQEYAHKWKQHILWIIDLRLEKISCKPEEERRYPSCAIYLPYNGCSYSNIAGKRHHSSAHEMLKDLAVTVGHISSADLYPSGICSEHGRPDAEQLLSDTAIRIYL